MQEKQPSYSIRYVGANPESLDARELIQTLSAITKISLKAGQTTYGADAHALFRITHVQSGSIEIQGFIELMAGLQPAFAQFPSASLGIADVPELIKNWLDLLSFLKGQAPKVTQTVQNGNAIHIENVHGESTVINGNIYNTFVFNDVSREVDPVFGTRGLVGKLAAPLLNGADDDEANETEDRRGAQGEDRA